jgi:hypothetical protein
MYFTNWSLLLRIKILNKTTHQLAHDAIETLYLYEYKQGNLLRTVQYYSTS